MRPTADGPPPERHGVVVVRPESGYHDRAARDLAVLERWLRVSVGRHSPGVGRSGAVCPFTVPALRAGAVRFALRYDVDGTSPQEVETLTLEELRGFAERVDQGRPPQLDCVVLTFPAVDREHWSVIDTVHPALKDAAVDLGLMVGQFHPACDERAVRNPLFPVARSPLPLFAIRYMAPHDILFLHGERRWFQRYRDRFPEEADGLLRDGLMRELAAEATRRFGAPATTKRPPGGFR